MTPAQEQAVAQILVPNATTITATTTTPTLRTTTSTDDEVFLDNLPPELLEPNAVALYLDFLVIIHASSFLDELIAFKYTLCQHNVCAL